MQSKAKTPEEYLDSLDEDRQLAMQELRQVIKSNLPDGFEECMSYGMIGYVVPHSIYPQGYHCDPSLPLPFLSIASQKNFIAVYHMGIYTKKGLYDWFVEEYGRQVKTKLDMGKSCIRFKKINQIPYKLIGDLCKQISLEEWLGIYEESLIARK